ncbi:MAG: membrane protein insertion efficiency factor YidD [Candidatus Peribacteraceae bacterium]|nr:membrane protein insertion efficiency factor YidD [Candidatus Peribacteraceae bacterium]
MRNPLLILWLLPRKAVVMLITLYQQTLSPDHGPLRHLWRYGYCRHEPTCSEYGKGIILKRGLMIGGFLTIARLLTCHPWRTPSTERIMRASHRDR